MDINLLYDIPVTKIDTNRPIYNPDTNTIIFRPGPNFPFKYYLEAVNRDSRYNIIRYIIFSTERIHEQCRSIKYDNYGRIKIHTYAFREWLQSFIIKESNISIVADDINEEYLAVRLNVDGTS